MNTPSVPDQPATTRRPAAGDLPWSWRLENAAGEEVVVTDTFAGQRFDNQADAESWVGEIWAELAAEGVDAVVLFEHERRVYGPMSLHA